MGKEDPDARRARLETEWRAREAEKDRLRPNSLNLGELIAALEAEDPTRTLPLGFANPHSYRGYYDQLAFEPAENVTVGSMLEAARSALGTTYQGWKGGDYEMSAWTECWLAFEGEGSGETLGRHLVRLLLAQGA